MEYARVVLRGVVCFAKQCFVSQKFVSTEIRKRRLGDIIDDAGVVEIENRVRLVTC